MVGVEEEKPILGGEYILETTIILEVSPLVDEDQLDSDLFQKELIDMILQKYPNMAGPTNKL